MGFAASPPWIRGVDRQRLPRIDIVTAEAKERGHYADYRGTDAIDVHLPPDNAGISSPTRMPELMTDHDRRVAAGKVFSFVEESPPLRLDSDDLK